MGIQLMRRAFMMNNPMQTIIKPTVECRQIEPVEGDAVIIEAAYNAYCHQQQQWQYQYGHPAGNPVVEPFAFFEAGGV